MNQELIILLPENDQDIKSMLPLMKKSQLFPFSFKKETIAQSLAKLISDVNEIIKLAESESESAQLESISISAEISAEGGISWIGQAAAGYTNAMTLTFKLPPKETKD